MRRIGVWLSLIVVAALTLGGVQPARADNTGIPQTVDELLEIYGIANVPADYVVVVDTSGSMMGATPIYPAVRQAYASFAAAIGDQDHLSVITFDTNAVVQFNGKLGEGRNREAAASALPEVAKGARTDIGAALNAALDRLQRADAAPVQTVVFLTDGKIDAPNSPYRTLGSPAWQQLAQRAAQIEGGRSLAVYGAGLGGGATDVAVVKDVFPRAQIVNLPNDQLAPFFAEAIRRARVEKLRAPVLQEIRRNQLELAIAPGTLGDHTTLTLTLTSKLPHLGATVNLRGVTITDATGRPLKSTLVGGSRTVTVGPQRTSEPVRVDVEVPALSHEWRVGEVPDSRAFTVAVDAVVEVEPASILVADLGIAEAPKILMPDAATATRTYGVPYWAIGAALATLALVVWVLWWLYQRFLAVPRLRGGVRFTGPGDTDETVHLFRGREEKVPGRLKVDGGGSSVVFFTRRGTFVNPLSIRHPRIFVRVEDAPARVISRGYEDTLDAPRTVGHPDQIKLGTTTLTVIPGGKK